VVGGVRYPEHLSETPWYISCVPYLIFIRRDVTSRLSCHAKCSTLEFPCVVCAAARARAGVQRGNINQLVTPINPTSSPPATTHHMAAAWFAILMFATMYSRTSRAETRSASHQPHR